MPSAVALSEQARAVRAWLRRTGDRLPREALFVEFAIHRGYGPAEFRAALRELERTGAARWSDDGETLELVA